MPIIGIMASANWASANASSFESIATLTATGGETSLTFSSIPSTYKALQIRGIARDTSTTSGNNNLKMRINSDSGSNYTSHDLYGDGSGAYASGFTDTYAYFQGFIPGSNLSNTTIYGAIIIDIQDYASTTKNKTIRGFFGKDRNLGNTTGVIHLDSHLWISTSAISSITFFADATGYAAGTTFALYGIKGE